MSDSLKTLKKEATLLTDKALMQNRRIQWFRDW